MEMVEHWDVLQVLPESSANPNGMFLSHPGMRPMTLISKSNPASQLTPIAVQFG